MESDLTARLEALFPVKADEKWLASGRYVYIFNRQQTDVVEPWTIHACNGRLTIRSLRWVPELALSIAVCGELEPLSGNAENRGGLVNKFEVYWQGADFCRRASYRFSLAGVEVDLTAGSNQTTILETGAALCGFPLLRVFLGSTIGHILGQGGSGNVVVPNIIDPTATEDLLRPLTSRRSVQIVDWVNLPGSQFPDQPLIRLDYTGDQYGPGSLFDFHPNGLLVQYRWRQDDGKKWCVQLQDFFGNADLFDGFIAELSGFAALLTSAPSEQV